MLITGWLGLAGTAEAVPLWTVDGAIGIPAEPPRHATVRSDESAAEPMPEPEFVVWLDNVPSPVAEPGHRPAESAAPLRLKPGPEQVIETIDAKSLAEKFDGIGYRLTAVREGEVHVPRLFVDEMPRDMRNLESPDLRKRVFIRAMLPLILRANEDVRRERRQLMQIALRLDRGQSLDDDDAAFLDRMRMLYADADSPVDELLLRVDVVPPSLALAQAAEESGWGTSRFVREGNAVFGQRTFSGGGLVPLRRERDAIHQVRSFSHVQASVAAYLFNLNTHPAYARFRALRAHMRDQGDEMDSARLVTALERYSERGRDYIATIHTILRVNKLAQFDTVALSPRTREAPRRNVDIQPVHWSF